MGGTPGLIHNIGEGEPEKRLNPCSKGAEIWDDEAAEYTALYIKFNKYFNKL